MATNGKTGNANRLAAAGRSADSLPEGKVGEVTTQCKLSCDSCWSTVNAERDKLTANPDPELRNRKISEAYAELYQQDKSLTWIGLAAVVSRQAGCAMQYADKTSDEAKAALANDEMALKYAPDAQGGIGLDMIIRSRQLESSQTAKEALGEANKKIFSSMYPAVRFRQLYGLDKLKECRFDSNGKPRVPDRLIEAFDRMKSGKPEDLRSGADLMAEQEQRQIVEKEVYQVGKYKDVLQENENYSSWKRLWSGVPYGAKRAQIPLSSDCQGEEIPFDGSILNPDDRVTYYGKLMDGFLAKDQGWRDQTMNEIIKQGK